MSNKLNSAIITCQWDTMMGQWQVMAMVTFDDTNSKTTQDNRKAAYILADQLSAVLDEFKASTEVG